MYNIDTQKQWGKILRTLRENGENILYVACANLQIIDFTEDTIEITCKDDATFNILTKYRSKLGKNINIHKAKKNNSITDKEVIETLESLFGDRLTVKK